MNLINRAFTNLIRCSKKKLNLFALVFIIGLLVSGSLTTRRAIHNTEERLMSKLPAIASLDFNVMKHALSSLKGEVYEDGSISHISLELVQKIASLPQVQFYELSRNTGLFSSELELAPFPEGLPEGVNSFEWQLAFGGLLSLGAEIEYISLTGITNTRISYFEEEIFSLSDGRLFTQEELDEHAPVILVSRELADYNNLTIGSIINFQNIFWDIDARESVNNLSPLDPTPFDETFIYQAIPFSLEIIGIYDVIKDFDYERVGNPWFLAVEEHNMRNNVLAPVGLVTSIEFEQIQHSQKWWGEGDILQSESDLTQQTLFILYNSNELASFIQEATALLPNHFLEIRDLSVSFQNLSMSMEQLQWIADLILWGTVILSILVLSLLIILYLKDRKVEIGILLALGERKLKIVTQVLIEVLLVASFALAFSTLAGYYFSGSISRTFIQNNLIAQQEEQASLADSMFYGLDIPFLLTSFNPGNLTIEEMETAFDTSLSFKEILVIFSTGLTVTAVSTAVPIIYLTKISPRKVLM